MSIRDQIIKTSSWLIEQKTVSGDYPIQDKTIKSIIEFLKPAGLVTNTIHNDQVTSLIIAGKETRNYDIILHSHLDVVPGRPDQYEPRVIGDRLYGRGSLDMKGSLAVMLELIKTQPNGTNNALLITTDEEIGGHNGAGYITQNKLVSGQLLLTGEPTDMRLTTQEKGVIWMTLVIKGKSSHAAKPWEGDNPYNHLSKILGQLNKLYPIPDRESWQTTLVPTVIQSDNSQNQIPEEVRIKCDCRYVPADDPQSIIKKVSGLVDSIEVQLLEPPLHLIDSPHMRRLKNLVTRSSLEMHFATDVRYFCQLGVPSAIIGPTGQNMHGNNEWVSIQSLMKFYYLLNKFISNGG